MYTNAISFCENYPECTLATGVGREMTTPFTLFQWNSYFRSDAMELPKTARDNKCHCDARVLDKVASGFPVPDQKTNKIARLLVDQILSMFGVVLSSITVL